MSAETLQHVWEWLLSLSKIQLIVLGGAVSLLVAVSKIVRFFFLLGLLVAFLMAVLPELAKRYENSPLPTVVKELVRKGVEATQDPPPPQPEPKKADESLSRNPSGARKPAVPDY